MDMQSLYILRHAKAVTWTPATEDFSRHLQASGHRDAKDVASWICNNLDLPDCILCSPSHRTRETLAPLLSMQVQLERVTHFLPQLYHSSLQTLQAALHSGFAEADRVLIVGHNPGLEVLAGDVMHHRHHADFSRLPTGTLLVIDFAGGWDQDQGKGLLRQQIRGKELP